MGSNRSVVEASGDTKMKAVTSFVGGLIARQVEDHRLVVWYDREAGCVDNVAVALLELARPFECAWGRLEAVEEEDVSWCSLSLMGSNAASRPPWQRQIRENVLRLDTIWLPPMLFCLIWTKRRSALSVGQGR